MEDFNARPADSAEDLSARLGSQSAFVGSLTHALKGLLSSLEGGVYLIESGLRKEDSQRVESGTAMLQRNLGRARTLVGNTLYYARDREVQWEEMGLQEVVSNCAASCRRLAEQQGVSLEIHAVDGRICGDRFGVQALLANLAENAIVACGSETGVGGGRVVLSGRPDPPWAVLEASHDGRPMERATLARGPGVRLHALGVGPGGTMDPRGVADRHGARGLPQRGARRPLRREVRRPLPRHDSRPSARPA